MGSTTASLKKRMSGFNLVGLDILQENPAGLTGVWAEENTRDAIFNALQRRETYATSGPRHKLRFFGGWGFKGLKLQGALANQEWLKTAYEQGVPMGSDLPAPKAKAPSFIVWAVKDPDSGNLDRIQIIKGWTKNGQTFEKIYDVAWSGKRKIDPQTGKLPPVGNTVNISHRHLSEHHRGHRTQGGVDRSGFRSDPARPFTMPGCWKSPLPAGAPFRRGNWGWRRPPPPKPWESSTLCPRPYRSGPGVRPSGTPPPMSCGRVPSRA